MTKFTLTVSPKYVAEWDLWRAVRELLQNAIDQKKRKTETEVEYKYSHGMINISSSTGNLSARSLVLGEGDKQESRNTLGEFGEGYKLALVVLLRLGYDVRISNGDKLWIPTFEFNSVFQTELLTINEFSVEETIPGVRYEINGVSDEDWNRLEDKYISVDENVILPNKPGHVYVSGLHITYLPDFNYGYNFSPDRVKLERDRNLVPMWDIQYEAARLLAQDQKDERILELLESDRKDVSTILFHLTVKQQEQVSRLFHEKHGNVVPVSTHEDKERYPSCNVRVVGKSLGDLLHKTKDYFVDKYEGKSPSQVLVEFQEQHCMHINMTRDFEKIIELSKNWVIR